MHSGDQALVNVTLLDVALDFEAVWSGRFAGRMDGAVSLRRPL